MNINQRSDTPSVDEQSAPEWMTKLPAMLRAFGAAAVLFSLYNFLFKGWEGSSDVVRYLMLLGHTGLLAAVALLSGRFFKEGKGPRLLLTLGLVSVTVNFSILGAFLLSSSGNAATQYPQYVTWVMDSFPQALMLTTAAMAILIPVVVIGFRALARGMSQRMTMVYLLGNLALLMPLRDPVLVTILAFMLSLYTLFISAKTLRQRTEVQTKEGMMALILQFLPVGVLLGRNIWLYSPEALMLGALALVVFIAMRQLSKLIGDDTRAHFPIEVLSGLAALSTGTYMAAALEQAQWNSSVTILLASVTSAAMLYELSTRAYYYQTFYRILATLIIAGAGLTNILFTGGLVSSLISLVMGLAMVVLSYFVQQRSLLIGGALMMGFGLVEQFIHALQWFDFGYWVGLALVGVVAIVFASVLESRGAAIKLALKKYWAGYREWSY